MLAQRRAAGLGCGNLKTAIADNGNGPLLHGKRPGPNWILADTRGNNDATVPGEPATTCGKKRKIGDYEGPTPSLVGDPSARGFPKTVLEIS